MHWMAIFCGYGMTMEPAYWSSRQTCPLHLADLCQLLIPLHRADTLFSPESPWSSTQMKQVFSRRGLERTGQVLVQTFKHFTKDNGPQWAAAIAYYSLLSIFPLLLGAVTIAAYFVDRQWALEQGSLLSSFNPISPTACPLPVPKLCYPCGIAFTEPVPDLPICAAPSGSLVGSPCRCCPLHCALSDRPDGAGGGAEHPALLPDP